MNLYVHEDGGRVAAVSDLRGPAPVWREAPVYELVEEFDERPVFDLKRMPVTDDKGRPIVGEYVEELVQVGTEEVSLGEAYRPTDTTEVVESEGVDLYLLDDDELVAFGWRHATDEEVTAALAAGAQDLRQRSPDAAAHAAREAIAGDQSLSAPTRDALLALVDALMPPPAQPVTEP